MTPSKPVGKRKKVWVGWMSFFNDQPCAFDKRKKMTEAAMPEGENWYAKKVRVSEL